jgi:hypothetical protein
MLVLLKGWFHEVCRLDALRGYDIHTKFHDHRLRPSRNIKGATSAIWGAVLLVKLKGVIYKVRFLDWLRCHDIFIKFHKDRFRHSKFVKRMLIYTQTPKWSHTLLIYIYKENKLIQIILHSLRCVCSQKDDKNFNFNSSWINDLVSSLVMKWFCYVCGINSLRSWESNGWHKTILYCRHRIIIPLIKILP